MYDATFKVVLFGDTGVGKSTFAEGYLSDLFKSDTTMTIGVDFKVKALIVEEKKVKLTIWNIGGEERFRFLLPTYVKNAEGGIFMYDITNYSSLSHIDDWLTIIRKRIVDLFPIILVGNKADLYEQREISSQEGIEVANSRDMDAFIECSAKTGENVKEMFVALTRLMLHKDGLINYQKLRVNEK